MAQDRQINERNRQLSERDREALQRQQSTASEEGLQQSDGQQRAEQAARRNARTASSAVPRAGWYEDPWRQAFARWWSGTEWTDDTRG
ncbi:DUF2510 domain-containing protein [Mycobacterium colombiense]|uniref:DUF2510 domain-containing protein n=1 Tax=Mycobacterium colombiense TaxID=339268 RepID=UPI003AF84E66